MRERNGGDCGQLTVPRRAFGRIGRDEGGRGSEKEVGAILVLWTVALTGILAFVALAVDFGNGVERSTNIQNAADAAALAGASQLPASEAQATSLAQEVVANYGITTGDWASCTPPTAEGFTAASVAVTCIAFNKAATTIWVELPAQSVPSLFGTREGQQCSGRRTPR